MSLTAAMAGIAGCAKEGTTPTAPTILLWAPAPTTSVPLAGATISGTVVGVASAASVRSQAALTVTVTSSGSSSTVDANGHFMLTNVPAGHVDLHFMGNAVDAHLGLDDVVDHATIVITVRVSGHDAHLEDNHDINNGAAEVKGTIVAGSLSRIVRRSQPVVHGRHHEGNHQCIDAVQRRDMRVAQERQRRRGQGNTPDGRFRCRVERRRRWRR